MSAPALPATPDSLVDRAEELARARALLPEVPGRLLTLTGPGGVGNTRLALALAASLAERHYCSEEVDVVSQNAWGRPCYFEG